MIKQLGNKLNKLTGGFTECNYYLSMKILRHNQNLNYRKRQLTIDL